MTLIYEMKMIIQITAYMRDTYVSIAYINLAIAVNRFRQATILFAQISHCVFRQMYRIQY